MHHGDPSEEVRVGDTLKSVNGFSGDAGLEELRRLGHLKESSGGGEVVLEFWSSSCEVVEPLDADINEWWLWHGAPLQSARSIAAGQFQVPLTHSRGMYGGGLYFAESVSKSDEYTDKGARSGTSDDEEPLRCLLLCRVAMGHVLYNDDRSPHGAELARQVLSGSHDSLLGDREACVGTHREFIVFDSKAVYPNHAVFYRRAFSR